MPCRFASSGTVATSRSASRAILALNVASNFLRDLVISVLHRLRQSRTLHTLTFGPISGVHFTSHLSIVWTCPARDAERRAAHIMPRYVARTCAIPSSWLCAMQSRLSVWRLDADEVHVLREPAEAGDTQDSDLNVTRTACSVALAASHRRTRRRRRCTT